MINPLIKHDLYIARQVLRSIFLPFKESIQLIVIALLFIILGVVVGIKFNNFLLNSGYRWPLIGLIVCTASIFAEHSFNKRVSYFQTRSPLACLTSRKSATQAYQFFFRLIGWLFITIYLVVITQTTSFLHMVYVVFTVSFGFILGTLVYAVGYKIYHEAQKLFSKFANNKPKISTNSGRAQRHIFLLDPITKITILRQIYNLKLLNLVLGIIVLVPLCLSYFVNIFSGNIRLVTYGFGTVLMLSMMIAFSRVDYKLVRFCAKFGVGFWDTVKAHSVLLCVFGSILFILGVINFITYRGIFLPIMLMGLGVTFVYMVLKIAYFRYRSKGMASLALQKDFLVFNLLTLIFFPFTFVFIFKLIKKIRPLTTAKYLEKP